MSIRLTRRGAKSRRFGIVPAMFAAVALTVAACSPGSTPTETDGEKTTAEDGTGAPDETDKPTDGPGDTGAVTITFRLWDAVAQPAYEESFDAFMAQNPDIKVVVEQVPWGDYWTRLPLDLQSGDMADIFWTNSSNYAKFAESGNLMNISEVLGDDHDEWVQSTVDLYTRDGKLYGVPQLWDSIVLFYNEQLTEMRGVDVSDLTWMPGAGEGDTLKEAATKLAQDANGNHPGDEGFNKDEVTVWGFNAQMDLQAIYLDFLAQAGAKYQDENDMFAFDTPEGVAAFQYIYDMVNTWDLAPSGADTNPNGDITRDMFVQNKLALFQSGTYNLKTIAQNKNTPWGIAPMVAGPEGRISVVHAVAAVGNANTKHPEEVAKVLRWLGSADGQRALASQGVAFPAAVDAQQAFIDYWAERNVDVQPFVDAAAGKTTPAPVGVMINDGITEAHPILQDILIGAVSVEEGVKRAQEEGNAAMR